MKRAEENYRKNPNEKNRDRLERSKLTQKLLKESYAQADSDAVKHQRALIKKYGKTAISDIKRDDRGRIKERTVSNEEIAASIIGNAASMSMAALTHVPIIPIFWPSNPGIEASMIYDETYQKADRMIKNRNR